MEIRPRIYARPRAFTHNARESQGLIPERIRFICAAGGTLAAMHPTHGIWRFCMIEVRHFSYAYGNVKAVDDISFDIPQGEVVALIGPNGAGKSTTMKALTTLLRPMRGNIRVAGYDVVEDAMLAREHLGYLPENNPLYDDMTVWDALRSIAAQRLIRRARIDDAVDSAAEMCGIQKVMHRAIGTLSRGYRQRVGIAQAIIHKPDVLILDEATTGLDPNQISEVRDLILQIGKQRTVLISTHILQEVSAIARRMIILCQGKIAADDAPRNLIQSVSDAIRRPASLEDVFRYFTLPDAHPE